MKIPYFMPISISLLAGLLIVLAGVAYWQFTFKPEPYKEKTLSADVLWTLANDYRISKGLQPFEKNDVLCEIARDRALDWRDEHRGLHEKYGDYPSVLSENQTVGSNEQNALDRWIGSTPHREALEKNWKYSCIATEKDFAVQIFSNLEHLSNVKTFQSQQNNIQVKEPNSATPIPTKHPDSNESFNYEYSSPTYELQPTYAWSTPTPTSIPYEHVEYQYTDTSTSVSKSEADEQCRADANLLLGNGDDLGKQQAAYSYAFCMQNYGFNVPNP